MPLVPKWQPIDSCEFYVNLILEIDGILNMPRVLNFPGF